MGLLRWLLGLVLIAGFIVMVGLPWFVAQPRARQALTHWLQYHLSASLVVEGPLSLDWFPQPTLVVSKMIVGADNAVPPVTLTALTLSPRWTSLWSLDWQAAVAVANTDQSLLMLRGELQWNTAASQLSGAVQWQDSLLRFGITPEPGQGWRGHLSSDALAVAALAEELHYELPGPATLWQAPGLATDFHLSPDQLRLDPLTLIVADNPLSGWLDIPRKAGTIRFDLAGDRWVVDSVDLTALSLPNSRQDRQDAAPPSLANNPTAAAPRPTAESAVPTKPTYQQSSSPERLPALEGEIRLASLQLADSQWRDIQLPLSVVNDLLVLQLIATVEGGQLQGRLQRTITNNVASFYAQLQLRDVVLDNLLALRGGSTVLEGQGDVDAWTEWQEDEPRTTLTGQLRLDARDGQLHGFSAAGLLAEAVDLPEPDGEQSTPFQHLWLDAVLEEGLLRSRDLGLRGSELVVDGVLRIDLPRETLTARLWLAAQAGQSQLLGALTGIPVPVTISGPLQDPEVEVDLEGQLREQGEALLGEGRDRTLQDAERLLRDALGDGLGKQADQLLEDLLR